VQLNSRKRFCFRPRVLSHVSKRYTRISSTINFPTSVLKQKYSTSHRLQCTLCFRLLIGKWLTYLPFTFSSSFIISIYLLRQQCIHVLLQIVETRDCRLVEFVAPLMWMQIHVKESIQVNVENESVGANDELQIHLKIGKIL